MHGNVTLCLTNALSLFFLIIQFNGVWGPVCGSTAVSFPSLLYWAQCRLSGLLQRTNFTTITGETRCVCLRGSYCQLLMSDFELPACQVQVGKFTHTAVKCYVKTTGKRNRQHQIYLQLGNVALAAYEQNVPVSQTLCSCLWQNQPFISSAQQMQSI